MDQKGADGMTDSSWVCFGEVCAVVSCAAGAGTVILEDVAGVAGVGVAAAIGLVGVTGVDVFVATKDAAGLAADVTGAPLPADCSS